MNWCDFKKIMPGVSNEYHFFTSINKWVLHDLHEDQEQKPKDAFFRLRSRYSSDWFLYRVASLATKYILYDNCR